MGYRRVVEMTGIPVAASVRDWRKRPEIHSLTLAATSETAQPSIHCRFSADHFSNAAFFFSQLSLALRSPG
jgi:hypothetical protein